MVYPTLKKVFCLNLSFRLQSFGHEKIVFEIDLKLDFHVFSFKNIELNLNELSLSPFK